MLNTSGSELFADGPPPPQLRAQKYMLTEIIKFVAAWGVFAEFLDWSNVTV